MLAESIFVYLFWALLVVVIVFLAVSIFLWVITGIGSYADKKIEKIMKEKQQ